MKIIICGAGKVGFSISKQLSAQGHSVTVIDQSSEDIKKMSEAGKIAAKTLEMIEEFIKPGVSTGELDSICHKFITEDQKCIPAPLNNNGFPKSICIS